MILSSLAFSGLLLFSDSDSITFKKINSDSVLKIQQSDGDMYGANTISVTLKNGKKIPVLYDKEGRFDPKSLITGLNNSWFSIGNPNDSKKKGTCIWLVCSLKLGMCKCSDILNDPGYIWFVLDDSGSVLIDKRHNNPPAEGIKDTLPDRMLTEAEMTKRFLNDSQRPSRIKKRHQR